jgi:sulfur carrier protein ThiS
VVEGIRKVAGNKGLDIQFLEDREIAYLVGKFITFETASEYADLLNRNGYRDSKVVARLGEKEISVETAKKLFEKLK